MRKMVGLLAFVALMTLPVAAQGGPAFEVGGGYTYRSFDAQPYNAFNETPINEPRMAMNGWNATAGFNFNTFIGVVTDFDMTTKNSPNDLTMAGKNTFSTLMIGPQFYPIGHHKLTPFVHVEAGLAHFNENLSGISTCGTEATGPCNITDGSFAFDFGGGVDFYLTRSIAIRVGELDYDQSRMFGGAANGNSNQNNWKIKAGIIFRFGPM